MIKAPFMGLIIGLISCVEGYAVAGRAIALGGILPLGGQVDFHGYRGRSVFPCCWRLSGIDERARPGRRRLGSKASNKATAAGARNRHQKFAIWSLAFATSSSLQGLDLDVYRGEGIGLDQQSVPQMGFGPDDPGAYPETRRDDEISTESGFRSRRVDIRDERR